MLRKKRVKKPAFPPIPLDRLENIQFQCIKCTKIFDAITLLGEIQRHEEEIREKNRSWIMDVKREDEVDHEPETLLLHSDWPLRCPSCRKEWVAKVHFTAYKGIQHEFYFSDIEGCRPYLPFQVTSGRDIKDIVAEFLLRWYSLDWKIHIVTPYFDEISLQVLGTLPSRMYYTKKVGGGCTIPLIITRPVSFFFNNKSGAEVLNERFREESCANCKRQDADIPVCDFCFQWAKYLDVKTPKAKFHAKWFAGIHEQWVEILISSHNLGKFGNKQQVTIGLIQISFEDYQSKFLDPLDLPDEQ